jgi:excisionase family DNA binding protein
MAVSPARQVDYIDSMEGYLTLADMAQRLGISHPTLRQQIAKGVLKAEKFGRDWAISEEEFERYKRENYGRRGYASPLHMGRHGRKPKEPKEPTDP